MAAARPLDDRLAERFAAALYQHDPLTRGVVPAYRDAVDQLRGEQPGADWSSVRLLTR